MHFCIKCICNILLMRCKNAFLHQMHLMQKCIFATQNKMYASNAFVTFCFAEHFPLENVMLNILLRKMYAKMHFCIKCIFAQRCVAKMHFCIKCIFATQRTNKMYASLFFAKQKTQHFCIKCIFAQPKCICNILCYKM